MGALVSIDIQVEAAGMLADGSKFVLPNSNHWVFHNAVFLWYANYSDYFSQVNSIARSVGNVQMGIEEFRFSRRYFRKQRLFACHFQNTGGTFWHQSVHF